MGFVGAGVGACLVVGNGFAAGLISGGCCFVGFTGSGFVGSALGFSGAGGGGGWGWCTPLGGGSLISSNTGILVSFGAGLSQNAPTIKKMIAAWNSKENPTMRVKNLPESDVKATSTKLLALVGGNG